MKSIPITVFFLVLLLVGGCAGDATNPDGGQTTPPSATIGPQGGSVEISGTADLEIPAGALATDLEISATVTDMAPPVPAGHVRVSPCVELTPMRQVLAVPGVLTLNLDPLPPGVGPEQATLHVRNGEQWIAVATSHLASPPRVFGFCQELERYVALADTSTSEPLTVLATGEMVRSLAAAGAPIGEDQDRVHLQFQEAASGIFVSAGGVIFRDTAIPEISVGDHELVASDLFVPGLVDTVLVLGSEEIPRMLGIQTFPLESPRITAPAWGTEVADSGITLIWSGAGTGTIALSLTNVLGSTQTWTLGDIGSAVLGAGDFDQAGVNPGEEFTVTVAHRATGQWQGENLSPASTLTAVVTSTTRLVREP